MHIFTGLLTLQCCFVHVWVKYMRNVLEYKYKYFNFCQVHILVSKYEQVQVVL